jgi:CDP-diacylglycerol--glycerol-3-phosphate 3-phosphatidyltransferase
MWTLPNLLSTFRLVTAPALLALAWCGEGGLFVALLVTSLATDVLDGQIARRRNLASELGARLDSWGDLATYTALPFCSWWLYPEMVRAEAPWLAVAVSAFVLPIVLGLLRFGRITSYHTWAAKLCAWLVGAGALSLFVGGPAVLFHAAVVFLVYEALEEIAITAVLPAWRTNVPTVWHAIPLRRRQRGAHDSTHGPGRLGQDERRSCSRRSSSTLALTVRRSMPRRRAASS